MRARLTNESGYTLLPGVARVYLGGDSIGTTRLGETPTGGELELWFGKEPRVTVKRELVSKKASESGVFSKSKGIDREYRVSLVNMMPQAVAVEVWDRVAVSRDEKIKLELTGVAPALAADAKYLKDERPQGLLKWVLSLPARGEGRQRRQVALFARAGHVSVLQSALGTGQAAVRRLLVVLRVDPAQRGTAEGALRLASGIGRPVEGRHQLRAGGGHLGQGGDRGLRVGLHGERLVLRCHGHPAEGAGASLVGPGVGLARHRDVGARL
jgi:hypothetical protein